MKISASFRIQEEIRWHMRQIEAYQIAECQHQAAIENLKIALFEELKDEVLHDSYENEED